MSISLKPDQSLVSGKQAIAAFSRLLESLNTAVSLSVYLQLKYGCYDDLVNRKIKPVDYANTALFRKDYQAVKGLSKAVFLPTSLDKRKAALDKFWEAEGKCAQTNSRFDALMYEGGLEKLLIDDPRMFSLLSRAQNQVHKILGETPHKAKFRFGPGVTSLVKRNVTLPQKYARVIHVTPELYPYWRDIVGPLWGSNINDVTIVTGNAISFVEKNAKTDRAIAVEPHVNVYAQLGIGGVIRDRLRRWVDLDTGQEVNRFLASKAQSWDLATVDLESASDTISRSLVWFLLPEKWAVLLDKCRSHRFTLNGVEYESNKFSSMGNGFTFELETVIFYALARACGSHRVFTSAFGDDIIAEACVYSDLKRLLEFCGFTVNLDKTFACGSFYESCGSDFFDGVDVRPFFWKDLKPLTAFKFMNDISKMSLREDGTRDRSYYSAYSFLESLLPEKFRECRIPYGNGDVGILSSWDSVSPSIRRNDDGWCGFTTKAVKFQPRRQSHFREIKGLLASLDQGGENSSAPVRGQGVYKVGRFLTFGQWTGPGPWVS
jgi:hypothetical protein